MLCFILPLMSRRAAKDFNIVVRKLEQTLKSICNQTSPNYHVLVICHELPAIAFSHPNVTCAEVDFDVSKCFQEANTTSAPDPEELLKHRRTDKGRKMLYGYYLAQQYKPTHIMFVDADDLVSNKLAELCDTNPTSYGWFADAGYRYFENSNWIYLKRWLFHKECGSSFIIRNDCIPAPAPRYDEAFAYYEFFISHSAIEGKLRDAGTPLQRLPLFGVIYVVHGSSLFATSRFAHERFTLLTFFKYLLNYRPLTQKIVREFHLDRDDCRNAN